MSIRWNTDAVADQVEGKCGSSSVRSGLKKTPQCVSRREQGLRDLNRFSPDERADSGAYDRTPVTGLKS
jgi:hypothetical protein